ncbi:MAG: hypothetical protein WAT58_13325 [Candidatus Dormiibacterota bacterium]
MSLGLRLVSVAASVVAAVTASLPASAATVQVRMHEFMFCVNAACTQDPTAGNGGVVTINRGDTVQWVWDEHGVLVNPPPDPLPNCDTDALVLLAMGLGNGCPGHTVTKPGEPYGGACSYTGQGCPLAFTFTQAGTFHYYCAYHGGRTQGNTPNQPITNMDGTVVVRGAGTGPNSPTTVNASTGQVLPDTRSPGLPLTGTAGDNRPIAGLATAVAAAVVGVAILSLGRIGWRRRRPRP